MTYIATSRVNGKGDYAPYQAQKITKDLGGKWHGRYGTVCCPCHDDKNPSLQISDADDGSLIVHCHGGCDWKVIKDELKRRGLYDDGFANGGGNVVQMPVPSAAISAIVSEYPYTDQDGKVLYQVVRYTNKQFRQRCPDGNGGWIWRGPKTAVPYRLPNLIENADQPILIAEGEKDVDNLAALGFTATCNHGGAGKWYSELTPWFKDRRVFILVDNDDAGEKHQALVGAALKVAAEVRVVRFPELPPKGDVSDYLEPRLKDGATTDEIKQDLTRRFREAPAWEPASEAIGPNGTNGTEIEWPAPDLSILDFKELSAPAFPSEVFGTFWSQWIEAQAEAKSCPQDYVGLGLIGGSSALIGNARRASPWKGWTEALPVWICEVGKPSSGKSPGLDAVRAELADIEDIANKDYENLRLQWDTKKRIAKAKLDVWESDCRAALKEKKDTPSRPVDADEPERVTRKRIVTNDPTTEKVARLVVENPKGIVLFRDELSGWVGSLNKYGGNGGDRAFYLEAYGGRPYAVDRIKDPEPIVIKSLCLGRTSAIQA